MKTTKIIIGLLAALLLVGCGINSSPGQTDKIGTIVRVGKVGIMTETWEAQLVRGGFQNGSGAQGAAFNFTIEDYQMAQLCKKYMEEGREVKITYRSEWIYSQWRSESGGDFLIKVEPLPAKTDSPR